MVYTWVFGLKVEMRKQRVGACEEGGRRNVGRRVEKRKRREEKQINNKKGSQKPLSPQERFLLNLEAITGFKHGVIHQTYKRTGDFFRF